MTTTSTTSTADGLLPLSEKDDSVTTRNEKQSEEMATEKMDREANIEKTIKFWNHPSLASVSPTEKMKYLHSKGVSDELIHDAWDRIVSQENPDTNKKPVMTSQVRDAPLANRREYPPHEPHHQQQQHHSPHYGAPPQHQYHHGPQQGHPFHSPTEQEETHALNGAALLTVGGMLGLGAAATVRWLNGGDFLLFPPPNVHVENSPRSTANNDKKNSTETTSPLETNQDDTNDLIPSNHDIVEDEEEADEHNPWLEQFQELTTILQSHVAAQEGILQRLTANDQREVTDRSMELLRPKQESNTSNTTTTLLLLWTQLVEIRAQLTSIQATASRENAWESDLQDLLPQLSSCIQAIEQETGLGGRSAVAKKKQKSVSPVSTGKSSLSTSDSMASSLSTPARKPSTGSGDHKGNESHKDGTDDQLQETHMTLRSAVCELATNNEPNALQAGAQLLYLYTLNLSTHPNVPRYRKIYTNNDSFKKVSQLKGGRDLLLAVGFVDKGNFLEWQEQDEKTVMTRLKEAAAALSILKSPQQEQSFDSAALIKAATAVLSEEEEPQLLFSNTPMRTSQEENDSLELSLQNGQHNEAILQTPQPNILVSPPTTKKHPFLSSTGFPEAPLSILNESNQSEELSTSLLDISSASLEIRPTDHSFEPQINSGAPRLFPSPAEKITPRDDMVLNTCNSQAEMATPMVKNRSATVALDSDAGLGEDKQTGDPSSLETPKLESE